MNRAEKYASATSLIGLAIFVVAFARFGMTKSILILPVAIALPIAVYYQFKPKKMNCSAEVLVNELPSVVGLFSITLSSGGSFDTAVRNISEKGPKNIASMFKKIVMDADCRIIPDIKTGINSLLSSMPKELSHFRRAMVLISTAFDTNDSEKRKAMIKDAENIVLSGLKETGESYSARLNMPCTVIFGVGIMIPMILVSVLPMLGMGGQFSTGIDEGMVSVVTLVAVPAFVVMILLSLKGKNPFFSVPNDLKEYSRLLILLGFVPIFVLLQNKMKTVEALVISLIIFGAITAVSILPQVLSENKRRKTEILIEDSLFELANRLMSGENFDVALKKSLASKDCSVISEKMEREIDICRGDVKKAISDVFDPISKRLSGFYSDIYEASLKDVRDSGKLALSIAHQIQDQNSVRKGIEIKLKNMLDMMNGTAAVFAPLILGMSIVMLSPLSELSGNGGFENMKLILVIYLVELSALISVLSTNLLCKGKISDILFRFSVMMPVSLIVFSICCSISI